MRSSSDVRPVAVLARKRGRRLVAWIALLIAACTPTADQAAVSLGSLASAAACPVGTNVIVGTAGDDVLTGTNGADCILGLGGADIIDGRNGADFIFGGEGNDILDGSQQADTIDGEAGDDTIHGGQQADVLHGGDGDDRIYGDEHVDQIFGDDGNDILVGGNGGDVVRGGLGCDRIDATNGPDLAYGDDGNDIINGGHAPDGLHGGQGDDRIVASGAPPGSIFGEGGNDACVGSECEQPAPATCETSATCGAGLVCVLPPGVCAPTNACAAPPLDGGMDASLATDGGTDAGTTCTHSGLDTNCNGIDDDCDGEVDEGFVSVGTSCGIGACASTGATSCVGGVPSDSCVEGTPAESDGTCDGIDDECNGAADEDYLPVATTCGVGACAATGTTRCAAGTVSDSCSAGAPAGSDATCDGVDDDCSGVADEDYASTTTSCGVGACSASGTTTCVAGAVVDSCTEGSPAASDATCDGIDDDCSGAVDEDYASVPTTCGVGACGATGVRSCVAGAPIDSCAPGAPAAGDATCDGIDDDCDAATDEAYLSAATSCGVGACAATGTTSCVLGLPSDSCTAGTPGANDAVCNGIDDDCNGTVDEDYLSTSTTCGVGACAATGSTACVAGVVSNSCSPGAPAANDATCDGVDDDCSGAADEDYLSTSTSCGIGACSATGATSCVAGAVANSCSPGVAAPSDVTCDGADDDCDGATDEGYVSVGTACGIGACAATGSTSCTGGAVTDTCAAGVPAATDATCDGIDDDCSGARDEDYLTLSTSCGVGACAAAGSTACVSGTVTDSCSAGSPGASDATCDGIDDDCSGATDEDFLPSATSCGVGACSATGSTSCVAGTVSDSCAAGSPASSDATCDGIDDDCSGAADEDYVSTTTSCGVGACSATGVTSCGSGSVSDSCAPGAPGESDATCDGIDDDCSGATDEDYVSSATSCGVGACAATGSTSCVAGTATDSCSAGSPAANDATCNAVDDDCDAATDEDYASTATGCGVGACASTGSTSCVAGSIADSCSPGTAAASDATCDAIDDDCDAVVDEDYAATPTACGVGACAASGTTSCVAGVVGNSCSPGAPAANDATCNAIDDDCNAAVDEDYLSTSTSCGVGACAATGATSCIAGAVTDSCSSGSPAANDAICNGIDDDCNAAIDEDYAPTATACGVGACASTGTTACVAGSVSNSCAPGFPAANDATCNAIDDDCNAVVDEDYVSTSTSCGVGGCASTGATSCVAGSVANSCSPGTPAATDASCNAIDDDCNAAVDEDYVSTGTACGVGACASTGATSCVGGSVSNSCSPGTPAANDAICNAIDDDCNAAIDEDYASMPTSCGVGACHRTGMTVCSGGGVSDSCDPGAPTGADATCDGVDDDCDTATDEAFAPTCSGSSTVHCASGALVTVQCSDADACTGIETCASASCVAGTPPAVDDGNPCTTDACSPSTGVSHTAVANGTSCSDSNACNGAETCSSGTCAAGTPPSLDDGNACTTDACDSVAGVTHDFLPDFASCDDGDPCNGIETCDGAGYCLPGLHPLSGPCAPAAPVARIFVDEERYVTLGSSGASIASFTGTSAPTINADGINFTPTVVAGGPTIVMDLTGSEMVAIERLRLRGNGSNQARHIQIDVSRTGTAPGDFVNVFAGETPQTLGGELKIMQIAPAGTAINARFVRIRILDNWQGQLNQGAISSIHFLTRPRDGGGVSMFEAGGVITATSTAPGSTASRAIDSSTSTFWQGNTPIASQSVTVDLLASDWQRVDRFRMFGGSSTSALVRDFEIWGSATGSAPTDFTFLMSGTLPVEGLNYWFFMPEANVRHVQLRTLTNQGFPGGVAIADFQTVTSHEGGLTVPFQSRSVVGGTPVVAYRWNFGDGTTSGLENPTHTFPAPGAYVVTLEVQDAWGLRSSTEFPYYADAPPVADFTYTPTAPTQSQSVVSTDRSTPGDAPLIRAEWTATTSTGVTTTATGAVGGLFGVNNVPTGPLAVTVTAVDARFLRSSLTRTIDVAGGPPAINVGADQTRYWGEPWQSVASPSVTDPSLTEAATLTCHYDFGDGATANVTNCSHNGRTFYVSHAWADPGTYEVVVTVTDAIGLSAEDRFFVEVVRRDAAIALDPIAGAVTGGVQAVTVVLADAYDPTAPMTGRSVTASVGASTATDVVGATGSATVNLDFGAGGIQMVHARFEGDSHYNPTRDERRMPEAATGRHLGNCGTEFYVPFLDVCPNGGTGCINAGPTPLYHELVFVGEAHTMVRVDVPGLALNASVLIASNGVAHLALEDSRFPATVPGTGTRSNRVVHVTAAREICLDGYHHQTATTDGFLGLPVERLGTDYVVGGWQFVDFSARGLVGIAATADATSVTITPSVALQDGPDSPGTAVTLPAGVPFTITLNRGEGMAFRAASPTTTGVSSDVTGTLIHADHAIAVFGGHQCAGVPLASTPACNYLMDQMPPNDRLGTRFFATPFATRLSGYVLRVVAATSGTTVTNDGVVVATLAAGQRWELSELTQAAHEIVTSAPALVMQYARGTSTDSRAGDPLQLVVPPLDQYGSDALFGTMSSFDALLPFDDWINIVARLTDLGGVRVDGNPVTAPWTAIGGSGFAYAQIALDAGVHRVTHPVPAVTFGIVAYGWASADAYGYPAQLRMRPLVCTPTTMVAGDGLDNECDGRVDEETANGLDDDGDGLIDEDLVFTTSPPVNVPPIAYDRTTGVREDAVASVVLAGFDANSDPLTYELLTPVLHGALVGSGQTFTYTPALNFNGSDSFTYRACDPTVCSDPATFTIEVHSMNDAPVITMAPTVNALEDAIMVLRCVASEVDVDLGCDLTWALVSGPPGMTIDADTGDIFWLPPDGSGAASSSVTVRVTDCHGAASTFSFGISVGEVPDPPVIISRPVLTAAVARPYTYDVESRDPDFGDTATYHFLSAVPAGMTMSTTTGLITWTPTLAQGGLAFAIEVVAVDDYDGLFSLPQRFTVRVTGDTTAPAITLTATPPSFTPGGSSVVHVAITDDQPGAVLDAVTINGTPITLDGAGNYTFTSATPGVFQVVATGHDSSTNPATATTTIRALDASDATPPELTLTAPLEDETLTYIHDAIGSVFDEHLYRWTLDMRRADRGAYFTVASGRTNVTGTLGQIDTTQLENGIYILRLRAEDVNGVPAEITRPIRVDGGAKVGVVQLSFTDLVTDDIGIPLAVVRDYDSRTAGRSEDFGYGWTLDMRFGSVQRNRAVGDGFAITTAAYPFSLPCQEIYEQQHHYVEVRLSDSEWYTFRPVIVNVQTISGHCTADVAWEQSDGVHPGAELIAHGSTTVQATALPIARGIPTMPSYLTDVATGEIYDPHRFQLVLRDGRLFDLSFENGIEAMADANGNTVLVRRSGLFHSSGRSTTFVRDARNRITQVIGTDGRSVGYEYSTSGNLAAFIDAMGRRTSFEYRNSAFPHHLTDIIDHRGVRTAAIDYQAEGRLGQICDPDGACLRNVYDLGSQVMTTTDGLGVPTQFEYDRSGNVIRMRDGLGHDTTYTYYGGCGGNHLATETDPLGNRRTETLTVGTCDLESRTEPHTLAEDPETFTTRYTYDSAGRALTERLASGGTYHREYDAAGHETRVADDADTVVFARTFDAEGRMRTQTDRFGTTTYTYEGTSPRATHVVDGRGQVFDMVYDAMGHVTSVSSGGVTMAYRYDSLGRMLAADYGRGITVAYAYGDAGDQWTRITGPTFGTVARTFSSSGRLIGWTLPNGDTHSRSYDAAGRLRQEVDELGHVTTQTYDDAGRLESTTDVARAATTTYFRDDAGRVLSTTDPLGHSTSRTYDVRGGTATITDALTHTWTFSSTPTTSVSTTPRGETTTSISTTYGLPAATTFPGGASVSSLQQGTTGLDESSRFPSRRTDESGRARSFGYDTLSSLTSATDLGGNAWAYGYEDVVAGDVAWDVESGRVSLTAPDAESDVSRFSTSSGSGDDATVLMAMGSFQRALETVTSPEGELTRYGYDAGGHRDTVLLSNGGARAMTFVAGHLDIETLPFGTTLDYTLDAAFRVTERTGTDGALQAFTYGPGDRIETIEDDTGVTAYVYDAAGRFAGLEYPTGGSVEYGRDALDQITTVTVDAAASPARTTTYVRDAANHITEVHDPLGGVTYMTYDENGRLETRTLPNGVVSTYRYDARGWADTIVHARADGTVIASVDYTRSPSGEPTRIDREDGTYVLYDYDDALRLTGEHYRDAAGGIVDNITYVYDRDGNRTIRITSAGVEHYTYDPGSELREVTIGSTTIVQYEYDDAGRVIRRVRGSDEREITYDADDHLVRIADPAASRETLWDFDAAGRRVRREGRTAGVTTEAQRYLVAPTLEEDLESPHAVTTDGGATEIGYVFAGEHPLFRYDEATGEAVYYLQDSMGSTIGLVDDSGTSASSIHYSGFGVEQRSTGGLALLPASGGDFRFQGMWRERDDDVYYVRARVYDPTTGRFLSTDPAGVDRHAPDDLSPYLFARATPTTRRDPSGEISSLGELVVSFQIRTNAYIARAALTLSSLAASARTVAVQLHHGLPRFLAGFQQQTLAPLQQPIHTAFHQVLIRRLEAANIPLGLSRAEYISYFYLNPGAQRAAFDAVLETSRIIDIRFGTQITQTVWTNIMAGNFFDLF